MTDGTKKPFDITEAFCNKVPCKTKVAMVYARPLASGRWSTISDSDDPTTVGEAAIRVLIGPKEEAGDETTLDDDLFRRLSSDDIQSLAHAVAKANQLGELRADASTYEGLGELIIRKQAQVREEAKQLREKLLSATFGKGTAEKLKNQLCGMDSIRDAIKKSSNSDFSSTLIPPPPVHFPAPEATPIGRGVIDTAQHVAKVADQTANLVSTMSELTDTIVGQAIPEWRQQLEEEKKAATEANAQALRNLKVATKSLITAQCTLKWTIGIAVVTMAIQVGQFLWAEVGAAGERTQQAETEKQRHEATLRVLREQLAVQQQVLTPQVKKAAPGGKEQATAQAGTKPN